MGQVFILYWISYRVSTESYTVYCEHSLNLRDTTPNKTTILALTNEQLRLPQEKEWRPVKVMLRESIRNDDFQCNTTLQRYNNVVTIRNNVETMFQRFVELKSALRIVSCNITFKTSGRPPQRKRSLRKRNQRSCNLHKNQLLPSYFSKCRQTLLELNSLESYPYSEREKKFQRHLFTP